MHTQIPEHRTVASSIIKSFLATANLNHENSELSECGVDSETLATNTSISALDASRLFRQCIKTKNDEAFGGLEKPLPLGSFKILSRNMINAPNLEQGLTSFLDIYNLTSNSFSFHLEKNGHYARIRISRIHNPSKELSPYVLDTLINIILSFSSWSIGNRIKPSQISLDFPSADYQSEYPTIYQGAPVLLNQKTIYFSFPLAYLSQPIVQGEHNLSNYLDRAPLDIFSPLELKGKLTLEVRNLLSDHLLNSRSIPSLQMTASTLGTTAHTLRRKLKVEGTSYHNIRAETLRDAAIKNLQRNYSIEKISEHLGYEEPSAFIRAFKTWTGNTPLQFKKGLPSGS